MKHAGLLVGRDGKGRVFPGGIAGASLKLPSREPCAPPPRKVFPGGIAGASLKPPGGEQTPMLARHVFPGGIAGASLKPGGADMRVAALYVFSPAESPGPH